MWIYQKQLQHPVKIARPNPRLAGIIITALGGPDGETGAAMRYLNQRYTMPDGKVIGLSKIARIAEMCAKRLQLQERLTKDIWDVLVEVLGTQDVAVFVRGKHSCMTARGIKKPEALTCTNVLGGCFKTDPLLRAEVRGLL
jgi:hypothetical protein